VYGDGPLQPCAPKALVSCWSCEPTLTTLQLQN